MSEERLRRLRAIAISIAGWSAIALLFSLQRLFGFAIRGIEPAWDRLALEMAITWGGWAIVTPIIFVAVRRFPLSPENPKRVAFHLPIGIGVALIHSMIVAAITPLFIWRPSFLPIRDMFTGRLASAIAFETLIYFMVAAVLSAWMYSRESQRRQVAFSRAESDRARVEVEARRLEGERQRLAARLEEIRHRASEPATLAVPAGGGLMKLPLGSIDWLQAEDNYVRLHAGGRSHLVRTTLSALEEKLAAADFVRIHRSAVGSVPKIARLKRVASDRYAVVLADGTQLRVSRAYRKRLVAAMESPLAP